MFDFLPSAIRQTALLLLVTAVTSQAQTTWQVVSGAWNVGGSWRGGSVPGVEGFALIDNGGTATLGAGVSGTVQTLVVGRENGGTILINGGYLKNTWAILGQKFSGNPAATGIGTVTVSNGGVWDVSGPSGNPGFPASIKIGGYGSAGFLNILTSGTVLAQEVRVGDTMGGTGTLNMSGGMLSVQGSTTESVLWVGYENPGIYVQSGGVASLRQITVGSAPEISGSATVSSGTMDALIIIIGDKGNGVFKQTGGVVRATEFVHFGIQSGTGTLELAGGVFETRVIREEGGQGQVKLNGGTLRLTGNQNELFQFFELGDVTIESGGAFIDTNGYSIISEYSFTGSGRLTKLGEGSLTLTSAHYNMGGTTVKGGTLAISGSGASLNNVTDLRVGETISDDAALVVTDGTVNSNQTTIGFTGASKGRVTITNGAWTEATTVTVGYSGDGEVELNSGHVGINKDIVLAENSTASGVVTVNGGILRLLADFAVGKSGTGGVVLNGGEIILQGTSSRISIASETGSKGSVAINSGTVSGTASIFVGASGSGALSLNGGYLSSGAVAVGVGTSGRGVVTVNGGQWDVAGEFTLGAQGQGALYVNGGVVSQTGTTMLAAALTSGSIFLTNTSGSAGVFETYRIVEGTGSGVINFDGGILRALADESAFISGFENGDLVLMAGGGTIDSGTHTIGIGAGFSGTGGLTKSGVGTLTLHGTSTHTGATTVQAGQLAFNGVNSGTGMVTVQSGASLSGTGNFSGAVTIANGGILTPGNSAGILTVGSLILNSASDLRFELGTTSDLVNVTNALTLDGRLNLTALSGFGNGTYTLFQYGGELVNNGLSLESGPLGYYYSLDFSQPGKVSLLVDDAQYWDGSHTAPNGSVNGGNGTWNNTATNWTVYDGSSNQGWTGSAVAVFSGSSGVVDVADTVQAKLIDFKTDGYTLTGTGSLVGSGTTLTLNTGTEIEATINTNISGSATLVKGGDGGLVTLAGSNSYSGGTIIKTGSMAVNAGGTIAHSEADFLVGNTNGDDGTFTINGGTVTNKRGVIGSGSGSRGAVVVTGGTWTNANLSIGYFGDGSLTISGGYVYSSARSTLGYAGDASGTATVTGGTWAMGEDLSIGGGTGNLLIDGGVVTNSAGWIGAGTDSVGSATVTSGSWIMSSLLSIGSQSNSSGSVLINGGVVSSSSGQIGDGANATGAVTITSGTWTTTGDISIGVAGSGTLNLKGGTVSVNGGNGVVQLGHHAGSTGVLNIGTGDSVGTLEVASVNGVGGVATVNFNHTGSLTFASGLLGNLSVNKQATGTTILTGSNTYTGPTTINAGKLTINGHHSGGGVVTVASGGTLAGFGTIAGAVTVESGGTLAPGDSIGMGTLSLTSTVNFASGSLFSLEGDGSFFSRLDVTGAVSIASGAQISFTLQGPLTLSSYTLLTAASGLDGTIPFILSGSVPTGYELVYSGTSLRLVSRVEIGAITVTPEDSTIITGGTTSVTVTVENSGSQGSPDLNATVTGTGAITGSGTATVAAGDTGTVDPSLAFSSTAIGVQSGTVTVSDPLANNNPQTGTTTVTVLDHAAPTLVISGSNHQSVIVGATGITATLQLANGTSSEADRSPMTVQNLSTGLTGTTGVGVIASGGSSSYTASLDTSSVGAAQTQVFTLDAGDQQDIPGASPLTTQSGTVTLNVYGHAAPALSGSTFDLGYIHVGYGTAVTASQTVSNGAAGDYIVNLKADSVTSGAISMNSISGVEAGNSATITATFTTGQGVGAINETLAYTFADDSTLAGASTNVGSYTLNVTGLVYSGQGVWRSMSGGTWGTLNSSSGVNWQANGGTPGLDAGFIDTDTATFGTAGAGIVTLDGAAPSLKGLTFDNPTASYELRQGSGGMITLNGGTNNALIESLSGDHAISAPVSLATNTTLSVVADRLSFTADSVINGSGGLVKQGAGTVIIAGANSYGGGTRIEAGTVATANSSALGTGAVALDAGILAPTGTLSISSFTWSAGQLEMSLGTTSSLLDVTGDVSNGGAGGTFIFTEGTGFAANIDYTLLNFGTLTGFSLADFTGNALYNITPTFSLVGDELIVRFIGPSSGSILSNYAPIFTPTTADFQVNGNVQTSDAPNRVNSVIFADNSQLTVFDNLAITSGLLSVNSGSATLSGSGNVITPGHFTKLGGGLLNVLTNLLVNGDLQLQDGTLAINSNATMQQLLVHFGAILKGNGVINGNVFNSGTVAPGNSPGPLFINSNFTQFSSGTLEIEIASKINFDRLIVSGNAQLAGKLRVISFDGYKFEYGQQFAFLQADRISGDFDSIVTSDPQNFRARFLESSGTGSILIAPTSYTLVAQTTNQRNVAVALDSFISAKGDDRETVSISLDQLTAEQYPAAFEQIMPGFYESLTDTSIEQAVMQNQLLAQRMSAVRLGARGFSAIGIESPIINENNRRNGTDVMKSKDVLAPTIDNPWGVWVQGNGIFAKVVSTSQIPNYHTKAGGFLLGADYRWSENFATGVYVGYQGLSARYTGGSNLAINSALLGGYATYENGGFYADAMIGGGYNDYSARRSIEFGIIDRTARSTPNGGQFTSYLDAGHDWTAEGFTFGPIVSAQYTYIGVARFTESGANSLDVRVNEQNANSIRTNLGGRIAYTWSVSEKIAIIPEVRLFWQHEFLQNRTNIGASLDGGAGPGFRYETSSPERDSLFAGAGVSAQFGEKWGGYLFYNADFARQDYRSHAISAGLNWKF